MNPLQQTHPLPSYHSGQPISCMLYNAGGQDLEPWSVVEITGFRETGSTDPPPVYGNQVYTVKRVEDPLARSIAAVGAVKIPVGKYGPGFVGPILPLRAENEPGIGNQARIREDEFTVDAEAGILLQLTGGRGVNWYINNPVQPIYAFVSYWDNAKAKRVYDLAGANASLIIKEDAEVIDPLHLVRDYLNTPDGDKVQYVGYCAFRDNKFEVISAYGPATRVRGLATKPFTGSSTIEIDSLVEIDSNFFPAPLSSPLTVYNVHRWSGDTGYNVRAEYVRGANRWEAYQVDCE